MRRTHTPEGGMGLSGFLRRIRRQTVGLTGFSDWVLINCRDRTFPRMSLCSWDEVGASPSFRSGGLPLEAPPAAALPACRGSVFLSGGWRSGQKSRSTAPLREASWTPLLGACHPRAAEQQANGPWPEGSRRSASGGRAWPGALGAQRPAEQVHAKLQLVDLAGSECVGERRAGTSWGPAGRAGRGCRALFPSTVFSPVPPWARSHHRPQT